MKIVINLESKFDVGDIVTFDNGITHKWYAKVLDLKLSSSYKFLYKLEGKSIYYSEDSLSLLEKNISV